MALSRAQSAAFEKARAPGAGGQAVSLSDSAVRALVAITARDLGLTSLAGLNTMDDREFYEIAPQDILLEGEASGSTPTRRCCESVRSTPTRISCRSQPFTAHDSSSPTYSVFKRLLRWNKSARGDFCNTVA